MLVFDTPLKTSLQRNWWNPLCAIIQFVGRLTTGHFTSGRPSVTLTVFLYCLRVVLEVAEQYLPGLLLILEKFALNCECGSSNKFVVIVFNFICDQAFFFGILPSTDFRALPPFCRSCLSSQARKEKLILPLMSPTRWSDIFYLYVLLKWLTFSFCSFYTTQQNNRNAF